MTWDGIVTNYHKKHIKELGLTKTIEAYIQSKVQRKHSRVYLLSTDDMLMRKMRLSAMPLTMLLLLMAFDCVKHNGFGTNTTTWQTWKKNYKKLAPAEAASL